MAIKVHFSTRGWHDAGNLERMLDQMSKEAQSSSSAWSPAVDIYETPDSVIMVAEVAGVQRKEIKVIIDGDIVRIFGSREPTCCSGGARYHRMEMDSGSFVRSFRVQVPFNPKKVRAQIEDGLLYVILPKVNR
jgi:HSP20 family protein